MAKYERDTSGPEDVRVFDGGGDDEEEGGSHLPLLMVIGILVLAALGGVVWLMYNNGVARGRADVLASVEARNTPKEQPAVAPGTGVAPPKQIKIYQQRAGSDEDTDQETTIAPSALVAKPATPPLRSQPADAKPTVQPAPEREATAKPTPLTQMASPPVATPAKMPAAAPVKLAAVAPARQPVASPAKVAPTASAAGGAFVLQIGAYKSQSDADGAWKAYQAKHAALLSGFGPNIQKADLGDKGVWYRLRVGSFADKNAAAALCDRLKAEGAACFPAK